MPSAIEQIVDTYVRLNNRRALETMLMHRQRLAIGIKAKGFHHSLAGEKIDEDIAAIQAGLNRIVGTNPTRASGSLALRTEMAPAPAAAGSSHAPTTLSRDLGRLGQAIDLFGERAGDRTQDPVIKSHVLYSLSYALASQRG